MIFFDSIQHEHTNGHTSVLVKYDYPSERVILGDIVGPLKCKSSHDKPNTKFHFSKVRKDKLNELQSINLYDILEEWTPMLRFVDNNVKINLDIHGERKVIEHTSKVLVPVNEEGFRILQFSTPIVKQPYFFCDYHTCNRNVIIDDDTEWDGDLPKCGCGDAENVSRIDGESFTENLVAIESRISRSDFITQKVREYIAQESDFYQSGLDVNNPWNEVNEDDWYDQVRMRFGIETNYLQDGKTRPWLYSLAEITETTGWIDGDYESLHEDTAWSIDGPFFLHHNRKQLETDLQSSKLANFALIQQCLKRLIGRLAKFLHESDSYSSLPLASPLDRMITSYYKGEFENNATVFSPLIHGMTDANMVDSLKNYNDVFGGLPIFSNASNTLINPNIAKRIPSDWIIPGDIPLYDWISKNTDLTLWPELPTHLVGDEILLVDEQSVKLLNFVEEIDKHVLFSRLKENGYWDDLVNQYPSITKDADWLRIPLPEGTYAIVGASSGWPSSLDLLVESLRKDGVLFTNNEQVISVFCSNNSSGKWENRRDIPALSIPEEIEEVWWLNRLVEYAIKAKISLPLQVFEEIKPILEHEDSLFFLASLLHFPQDSPYKSKFENLGLSLIPYDLASRSTKEQTYVPRLGCSLLRYLHLRWKYNVGGILSAKVHESRGF